MKVILQYFWPALSNNWILKPIFGLFESGRFTQGLLYVNDSFIFFRKQQANSNCWILQTTILREQSSMWA